MTPRENALLALAHQIPERIVDLRSDCNMLATFVLRERAAATPQRPHGGDGVDWFGQHWKYESVCNAPMIDPAYPLVLTDITKWREQVVFPDLSKYDFRAEAEKELHSAAYDPAKLNQIVILTGPFERLMCLMGCVEALCAMSEEPEACAEFFEAMADHKIELIRRLHAVYPIDLIDLHDDWGTQRNAFMSVQMWKALLAKPIKRIHDYGKSLGIHMQQHSCGRIERLVPAMVEIGIDHWSSCQGMNDLLPLIHAYGDRMTFFGCFDTPESQRPGITQTELDRLTADRVDLLCRGGCVLPLGTSTVKGLSEAMKKALDARTDFFTKPENRVLP